MQGQKGDTKTHILEAAIRLWNDQGTASVSTNHIARRAGISPGNLYYHFQNKEEIIRATLERIDEAFGKVWELPAGRTVTLSDFQVAIERAMALQWEYRFFFRELVALIRRDPQLGRRYRTLQRQRRAELEQWGERFVAAGVLRLPAEPDVADALLTGAWLISDYWIPFLEASGTSVGPQQMRGGVDIIMRLLRPYLVGQAPRSTQRDRKARFGRS